jgi:hypothetical protein
MATPGTTPVCSAVEYFNIETTIVPEKLRASVAQLLSNDGTVLTSSRALWFHVAEVNGATEMTRLPAAVKARHWGKWHHYVFLTHESDSWRITIFQ